MVVTRRTALKTVAAGAGLATLAASGTQIAHSQARGRTFVLIHGAWHGGWCWRYVTDLLTARGHRVYAPSLTGLADRSHLLSNAINLDTHINDIINLFRWEDIDNAVLVGHSYGGWPISGAVEKIGDKVAAIVYLDAFLPENGQRGIDFSSYQVQTREAIAKGEVGRPVPKVEDFKILDPKNAAWVQTRMTAQPTRLATQPIVLTGARERIAKKTYIRAPRYPQPTFDAALAKCKTDPTWKTFELKASESGHDVMVDAPGRLVEILLQVA